MIRLTNTELLPKHREKTATKQDLTSAKRLHLWSKRLFVVGLTLWLTGCNSQPPAARGLPAAEVTVSKPVQKEILNWAEFTGRVAAVKFVKITPRVSGYIVDIPFSEGVPV
jgi:multidrug efflux pump subunit AcrA (membrane-fusion protein)